MQMGSVFTVKWKCAVQHIVLDPGVCSLCGQELEWKTSVEKHKPEHQKPKDAMELKLEQGLEESMAGSDPVSVTQPPKTMHEKKED